MATDISKPVSRRTLTPHRGKRVVVTIAPGDVIGFRAERSRQTYWTSIAACMDLAIKQQVAAQRSAKVKKR